MTDIQKDQHGRQFVTVYIPIFREKLEKLQRRGQGSSAEAVELRKTLALVDNKWIVSHHQGNIAFSRPFLSDRTQRKSHFVG